MAKEKPQRIKMDARTSAWFKGHPGAQTTVMCCEKCGLWYKPDLGHKCKVPELTDEKLRRIMRPGWSADEEGDS